MEPENMIDIILDGLDQQSYKPVIEVSMPETTLSHSMNYKKKLINHELSITQHPVLTANLHQHVTAFAAHTWSLIP